MGHKKHWLELPKVDRGREPLCVCVGGGGGRGGGGVWHNVKLNWPLCTVILITG